MENKLQLVEFASTDNLLLPGLLYEPLKKTNRVMIYLHGNGSSSVFYSAEKMNLFGRELNKNGVAFFPFNNRGAHWIKKLDRKIPGKSERVVYGMSYEMIKECLSDIDGAVDYLKNLGYGEFYLAGASTGANKAVIYNYYGKKNPFSKYILISGGDDTGLYFSNNFKSNKKLFFRILEAARVKIRSGKGRDLVARKIIPDQPISYQSLFDTLNPDGDYNIFPFLDRMKDLKLGKKELFKEFKKIDRPTLVIYGDLDEYCYGDAGECVRILRENCANAEKFLFKIIHGADHGFHGKEKELIGTIVNWLSG